MTDLKASMMTEGEFLEQAGVKGMKWGRRKSDPVRTSHVSADAARYKKIGARRVKNGADNLSNDDLAKLNKRSQLLNEYKKNNPGTVKKGFTATKSAVAAVGTLTAAVAIGVKVVQSPMVRKGAAAVVRVLSSLNK